MLQHGVALDRAGIAAFRDVTFPAAGPVSERGRYATGFTMIDYAKRVRDSVARNGFHTTSVGAGEKPAFSYSTGIYESYAIPEIIISALPPNLSQELISQYVDRFRATGPIIGERITAAKERFDYYLVPVPFVRVQDYVLATIKYYGSDPFELLQLIYPDTELLFPGEDGYDYDQELFGAFPPNHRA